MALTLKRINSHTGDGARRVLWDGDVSGLGLRVSPSAERTYVLKYRARDGRQRWYTIGRHGSPWTPEMARREAKRLLGIVAGGHDPADEKRQARGAQTLEAFASRYLFDHAATKKKSSSVRMDRINLAKHILPSMGRRTLNEISRADVAHLHSRMRRTPGAANRCLALLSKMMNLAEAWGLRPDGSNPCRHIEKYPERARKRYLSDSELTRLGKACRAYEDRYGNPYFPALVRLLVLTGARLSEIQKARWQDVDLKSGILRLTDSKTGPKAIVLPQPALDLLLKLPRVEGNHFIIVGKGSHHLVNVWKHWGHLRRLADIPDVRMHDLRHSFASVGAARGLSLNILGGLLGHTQAQTTKRYAHLSADPLKAAANQISAVIAETMAGASGSSADIVEGAGH